MDEAETEASAWLPSWPGFSDRATVILPLARTEYPKDVRQLSWKFEYGLAAYRRQDYATALKMWRPLAERGEAAVQSRL